MFSCTLGTDFSSPLSRERRAFTAAFEARRASGCPTKNIATGIGNRYQGVVGNVRQRTTDRLSASYPLRPSFLQLSSSHLYEFVHWFVSADLEPANLDDAECLDNSESL